MSVWLTPDLKPFVGGTYFPPEDRYGQPELPESAPSHRGGMGRDRAKISQSGDQIIDRAGPFRECAGRRRGKWTRN